jgi:hypothetical protein
VNTENQALYARLNEEVIASSKKALVKLTIQ